MLKRSAPMKRTALRRDTGEARLTVKLSERECEVCSKVFQQRTTMQSLCGKRCLFKKLREAEKAERELDKARREKLMTQPQWVAKAQGAVNAYIRARDAGKPCICCGRYSSGAGADCGGEWDAGHYRSRGAAPELRFDERNIHAQLKQCNRRAWDVAAYRANLIERIGLAEVEALEGPHPPRKWTIPDLQAITAEYRAKARALKARQ